TLNITKGQLASLLGTIPETLSRMMARMSIQKLIEVQGRGITIQNYLGLEDLAATGRFIEE
ncbi:MAG: winged helix-turn-helix domain-containing protein, partial [Deltaproteobacteria bacterium]|nr:winged helix-turn-helix domain-containing protein [Deltaproteobacteria bacterium]